MKEKFLHIIRYQKIKNWYDKYERILMPATLVLGVIFDALTFISIDITTTFILLAVYFFIAGATILFWNAYTPKALSTEHSGLKYLRLASPLILQFFFGALLSGVFIFYFFSGTVFVSWPFIVVLVLLMISNDVFRQYYLQSSVQIGVYYFILFSLTSIFIPFAFHSLNVSFFLISGGVSLLLIFAYKELLFWLVRPLRKERFHFALSVFGIFLFINTLYFLNIIPPLPLSLREVTLAHDIEREAGGYTLEVEEKSWKQLISAETFHKQAGENVYVYTAIFAPGSLNTKIIHDWQYFDEKQKDWVSKNLLSFSITGGRKQGYRGFSLKNNVPAGKWRVYVKTERGQVLGRITFLVENVTEPATTIKVVK